MKDQLKTIREALQHGIKAINHLGGAREAMPLHDAMPALTQLEAMGGEQEPVAYLDLGIQGFIDLGSDLTDDQISALPKGRHMLGIIGTYGIDGYRPAATQPAQQPQAEAVPPGFVVDRGFRWDGEKQQHIPQLTIEFEPVPANGPYDAQGWKDRDAVAKMFAAQGEKP